MRKLNNLDDLKEIDYLFYYGTIKRFTYSNSATSMFEIKKDEIVKNRALLLKLDELSYIEMESFISEKHPFILNTYPELKDDLFIDKSSLVMVNEKNHNGRQKTK